MRKFMCFDDGMGERLLNKLKTTELRFRETEVENYNNYNNYKLGVDNRGEKKFSF